MRTSRLLVPLLAGAMLVSCTDLNVTDPNQPNSQSAWRTVDDANRGLTAVYNATLLLGVFGRWQAFANDIRSDIGTARSSPWGDLASFGGFQLSDYNFEVSRQLYANNFEMVGRANVLIQNVPTTDTTRARIVGEAKFLRALAYYNLVTLYENVPLVTERLDPGVRPATAEPAQIWAQIEKDLTDAIAVLPDKQGTATEGVRGHATKQAAQAMLGRVRLQEAGVMNLPAKWAEASTVLAQVISSGKFSLLADYGANFRLSGDNSNPESIFEIETEDLYPTVTGLSFPKMIGPCYRAGGPEYNPTFCDGRPTRWYFDEFSKSKTTTGAVDPRLDVTLLYNRPDRADEMVYDSTRASYFRNKAGSTVRADTMIFFRKYGEWYQRGEQRWDNPINYKVIRYADVLLMQAEALNESGQTGNAFTYVNQVRARVGKSPLAGLSQAQLRDSILYERMFELGLESSRFNDLRRQHLLTPALAAHDLDFAAIGGSPGFVAGKSERLPIPTQETNLNPNVRQNPGW